LLVELARLFPAEQDKDRAYWEPLKRELESFRLAELEKRRQKDD
jgi:hypothetical protein